MVGVGYGKGASLPEERVRWVSPEAIEERLQRGERLRFFDARDEHEYKAGSLPGAESLPQTALMFTRHTVQPLLDDIVSGAGGADDLILFANTAGKGSGMSARFASNANVLQRRTRCYRRMLDLSRSVQPPDETCTSWPI